MIVAMLVALGKRTESATDKAEALRGRLLPENQKREY